MARKGGGTMKLLAIGDVVGQAGVNHLRKHLGRIKNELGAELVIVNGENAAEIHGIGQNDAVDLFYAGADVITTGNHAFGRYDIYSYLDDERYILRPANYPGSAPGHGYCIINAAGARVLVMNIQGNVSMNTTLASPFETADAILRDESGRFDIAILDLHAEATGEKLAMGYYLDGRVSVVFGTHTHVATADERILTCGTGFITDIGMTGPDVSILGVEPECIIKGFTTAMPQRYRVASGAVTAHGALFTLSGSKCIEVKRITF